MRKENQAMRAEAQAAPALSETQGQGALFRGHKDSVFRLLFNDKEHALELYSAISGKHYEPESTAFRFTTLEEVILKTKKNDISFLLEDAFIIMLEHQSTLSRSLTIRYLLYYADTIQRDIPNRDFYKASVKIPRPTFIVLYNGTEEIPDTMRLRLSENYLGEGKNDLQLELTVYNINEGRNQEIMEQCRTLQEYSRFVAKVREWVGRASGPLTERELNEMFCTCMKEGILVDFLEKYGTEVISMLYMEMTEEEARDLAREDGYETGHKSGLAEGLAEGRAEIIRSMKASGMSVDEIAEITGLTAETIEFLAAETDTPNAE